jgi:hypothetical protein
MDEAESNLAYNSGNCPRTFGRFRSNWTHLFLHHEDIFCFYLGNQEYNPVLGLLYMETFDAL